MKARILSIALTLVALIVFGTAQAQNAHFTDVVVSEDGLTITGKVAGLGNAYVGRLLTVTYEAEVTVNTVCRNRGNGNINPGNSGTETISDNKESTVAARQGNVSFILTLDPNTVDVEPSCPAGLNLDQELSGVEVGAKTLSFQVGSASGSVNL